MIFWVCKKSKSVSEYSSMQAASSLGESERAVRKASMYLPVGRVGLCRSTLPAECQCEKKSMAIAENLEQRLVNYFCICMICHGSSWTMLGTSMSPTEGLSDSNMIDTLKRIAAGQRRSFAASSNGSVVTGAWKLLLPRFAYSSVQPRTLVRSGRW